MLLHITHKLDELALNTGDVITVWLSRKTESNKNRVLQVELRVRPDGTAEIFSHKDEIELKDFAEWQPL